MAAKTLLATIDHRNGWHSRYYRISGKDMEAVWYRKGDKPYRSWKSSSIMPIAWLAGILKDAWYLGNPYRIESP